MYHFSLTIEFFQRVFILISCRSFRLSIDSNATDWFVFLHYNHINRFDSFSKWFSPVSMSNPSYHYLRIQTELQHRVTNRSRLDDLWLFHCHRDISSLEGTKYWMKNIILDWEKTHHRVPLESKFVPIEDFEYLEDFDAHRLDKDEFSYPLTKPPTDEIGFHLRIKWE